MMKPTAKSIQRVGRFLRKTIWSIKSTICSGDYKNLPNTPLLSPFSCSRRYPQGSQTKETYTVICCDTAVADNIHEKSLHNQHKKKQKKVAAPFEDAKKRGDALAQKMKDLNMVDLRDLDHALDVREALRCYSSIRSPVYLDIVDNFFTDMYYEFSDPRTSATINGSRRKAGSFRLSPSLLVLLFISKSMHFVRRLVIHYTYHFGKITCHPQFLPHLVESSLRSYSQPSSMQHIYTLKLMTSDNYQFLILDPESEKYDRLQLGY